MASEENTPQEQADTLAEETLLAIDLGLRCGLALYGRDGRLLWYRSSHFANRAQLKKAIYGILRPIQGLSLIMMEGDRELASFWRLLSRGQLHLDSERAPRRGALPAARNGSRATPTSC